MLYNKTTAQNNLSSKPLEITLAGGISGGFPILL